MEVSRSLRQANFYKLDKKSIFYAKKVRILKILAKKTSIKEFNNSLLSLTVTTTIFY